MHIRAYTNRNAPNYIFNGARVFDAADIKILPGSSKNGCSVFVSECVTGQLAGKMAARESSQLFQVFQVRND